MSTLPDEFERFYEGAPQGKCTGCGSYGTLYHFAGTRDICPFCVIRLARTFKRAHEAPVASQRNPAV
jgi:hypothetical protein